MSQPNDDDAPPPERPRWRRGDSFAIRPRTLIFVGVLAIVAGFFGLRDHIGFLWTAEYARAVVVSVETLSFDEGFPLHRPTVRYLDLYDGMTAVAETTYRPTHAGEELEIAYDPANPGDVRLMDPRDRWLLPLWMVVFGIVTVAIGIRRRRA